eukprot:2063417-Amphidinium_carterae.1
MELSMRTWSCGGPSCPLPKVTVHVKAFVREQEGPRGICGQESESRRASDNLWAVMATGT